MRPKRGLTGAIHHAADVAVQPNVVEASLLSQKVPRVLHTGVPHVEDRLLPELRVVVKVKLGVNAVHLPIARDGQRVDLNLGRVRGGEHGVQGADLGGALVAKGALELVRVGDHGAVGVRHAGHDVDRHGNDLLRGLRGAGLAGGGVK